MIMPTDPHGFVKLHHSAGRPRPGLIALRTGKGNALVALPEVTRVAGSVST